MGAPRSHGQITIQGGNEMSEENQINLKPCPLCESHCDELTVETNMAHYPDVDPFDEVICLECGCTAPLDRWQNRPSPWRDISTCPVSNQSEGTIWFLAAWSDGGYGVCEVFTYDRKLFHCWDGSCFENWVYNGLADEEATAPDLWMPKPLVKNEDPK